MSHLKLRLNEVHFDNSTLHKEFHLFEAPHKRSYKLEMLYNALWTIRPTSVEAEAAFSSAGHFFN